MFRCKSTKNVLIKTKNSNLDERVFTSLLEHLYAYPVAKVLFAFWPQLCHLSRVHGQMNNLVLLSKST
jgi:hypothetical protein